MRSARVELRRFAAATELVEAAARFVIEAAQASVAERGSFRIALAGGSTPEALYRRLAASDLQGQVPWEAVDVFFGDERSVPPDDPHSNYGMAARALLEHVPLGASRIHRIEGELAPREAARRYAERLGRAPLDLVLCGMGEDGHTASLFPAMPGLDETRRLVIAAVGPKPPPSRVTLSLGALNAARAVAFLVVGAGKATMLARVLAELEIERPTLPAAMVRPESGVLVWFVDDAAALLLAGAGEFVTARPTRRLVKR